MTTTVRFINKEDSWPLREKILRPGRPADESRFACDENPLTFHVGVFVNQNLMTVSTFAPEAPPQSLLALSEEFLEESLNAYRLRGMATDMNFQGQGAGAKAIAFAEVELQRRHCQMLWFNAREGAFTFYEKLGFQYHGEMFELPHIGPHKVMYKLLKSR